MLKISIPFALSLLLAPSPVSAEERVTAPALNYTLDENGLPIVSVTLHSMKNPNVSRTFRFVLDTGAGWCVLDKSVPSEFFWDENIEAGAKDIANQAVASSTVLLKRIEAGGLIRDGIIASRMDLRNQLGRFQDQPVDGLLGMSFLRGTRFLLEPKFSRMIWWGEHFRPGVTLPIHEGKGFTPRLGVSLGKQETSACLDTGSTGGVDLPITFKPMGSGETTVTSGASGTQVTGSQMVVERLNAGAASWTNLPVTFQAGDTSGIIGLDIWLAAPVCFDFITNHLTLSLDAKGGLPFRHEPSRKLPLMWDRNGNTPTLVVVMVKPGSAMEKAGCKAGDVLLQVGDLAGSRLTRRCIQDLVASGAKHAWVVRRNDQEVRLEFTGS